MCRNFMEFLTVTRSAYREGEDGIHDLFVGLPVKVDRNGLTEIVQITLTGAENKTFRNRPVP